MSSSLIPANMERFLQMTSQREQVVAANMANVDTPGYRAKDVSFEHTLLLAGNADTVSALPVAIRDEKGLMDRPDGNNVDLDRESLLLAKAQLQYGLGVQLIKSEFHNELTAINGGQ